MIMWKHTKDGDFSTNSAYAWLNGSQQEETNFRGKWIWKIDMLPRVIHFLWLCMHNSLPVRSVLAMRGITRESCCPLCNNFPETISHLLKECVVAKDFWFKLKVPHEMVSSFAEMDLLEWLKVNCQSKTLHYSSVLWSYVFSFAIGICGNIEMAWCSIIILRMEAYIVLVKVKPWNITIVWVRLGVKRIRWFVMSGGKNLP